MNIIVYAAKTQNIVGDRCILTNYVYIITSKRLAAGPVQPSSPNTDAN